MNRTTKVRLGVKKPRTTLSPELTDAAHELGTKIVENVREALGDLQVRVTLETGTPAGRPRRRSAKRGAPKTSRRPAVKAKKAKAPTTKKGAASKRTVRSADDLVRLQESIVDYLRTHPSSAIQAIAKHAGTTPKALGVPLRALKAANKITTKFKGPATRYSAVSTSANGAAAHVPDPDRDPSAAS